MKTVFRIALATLALLLMWAALVFIGVSEGWWKRPLAARGDAAAFTDAAVKFVASRNKGNAVFAIIENGAVHAVPPSGLLSRHGAGVGMAR